MKDADRAEEFLWAVTPYGHRPYDNSIDRLATLLEEVRADERERCAKVAQDEADDRWHDHEQSVADKEEPLHCARWRAAARAGERIAAAIRALGDEL